MAGSAKRNREDNMANDNERQDLAYNDYFHKRGVTLDSNTVPPMLSYLLPILPRRKDSRIIDIGCGLGEMLYQLQTLGYTNMQGVDISPDAVESCQRMNIPARQISGVPELNAEKLGGKFDLVIMSHVLEHIPKEDCIQTLTHIRTELLSASGKLLLRVPNAQANTGAYWMYEDFTHFTLFTSGSIAFVLKSSGFKSITFLNPTGCEQYTGVTKWKKKLFLAIYKKKISFWNKVTGSSFHQSSPEIYTFDLTVLAG
jgi:2-polyprenyl-3-methyl-5-hydroxy-6-metoxy-1,4-benzoquinol methylase